MEYYASSIYEKGLTKYCKRPQRTDRKGPQGTAKDCTGRWGQIWLSQLLFRRQVFSFKFQNKNVLLPKRCWGQIRLLQVILRRLVFSFKKQVKQKQKRRSICTHVHVVTVRQRFTVVHGCNNHLQQKAAEKCNILAIFFLLKVLCGIFCSFAVLCSPLRSLVVLCGI